MTTLERNRKAFYWIADVIEAHPELHDQGDWGDRNPAMDGMNVLMGREINVCGTAQCIAGWAAIYDHRTYVDREGDEKIVKYNLDIGGWIATGANILGLTGDEAIRLFNGTARPCNHDWPATLRAIGDGENIFYLIEC